LARPQHELEDAILDHLRQVALVKRALLQVANAIVGDSPNEAALILRSLTHLTKSADNLLGDTIVG
jgi:hypothetical protein